MTVLAVLTAATVVEFAPRATLLAMLALALWPSATESSAEARVRAPMAVVRLALCWLPAQLVPASSV